MALIFIGTIIVVIGVFLPWFSGTVSAPMISGFEKTVPGYEHIQGLISAGIAILSGILGFLSSGGVMPRKIVGFIIIIASIAVVIVSGSLIMDPGNAIITTGPFRIEQRVYLKPGVFITA